jgi:hypothetical protein
MSLEAALDEERREVMALLEGKKSSQAQSRLRASSPSGATHSPVRSMLDVLDAPAPSSARHASIAGQGAGITSAAPTIRSMLDPHSPPPPKSKLPATNKINAPPKINVEKEYNFEMLGNNEQNSLPKRVTQGGKAQSKGGIFNAHEYTRSDGSKALHGKSQKSHSPSIFGRKTSPKPARRLNTNSSSLMIGPNTFVTDSGQVVDMANAYRRLSDANLLKSGSALASSLPLRKGSDPTRGETLGPDGGIRLTKDYSIDDEEALDTSDGESNSSDEEWGTDSKRGRGRTRDDDDDSTNDGETAKGKRQPKSLLAAAEDESTHLVTLIPTFCTLVLTAHRKISYCESKDCVSFGSRYYWHRY